MSLTRQLRRFRAHILLPAILCACAGLPANSERSASFALKDTGATHLGKAVAVCTSANTGKDGVYPLPAGRQSFLLRMGLVAAAEKTLDLQYYIWKPDVTGQLLFEQVWMAAERGVRVRLLLDDQQTRKLDTILAALDAHPNIEIRLFNPYANRSFRMADIAFDFSRINRRMHNKAFIADNQVTIIGGRNIGNEYFGADPSLDYSDLDVAGMGPVVAEASTEFDLYWNSEFAYPVAQLLGAIDAEGMARVRKAWEEARQSPEAQLYLEEARSAERILKAVESCASLEWTRARILYDDPEKIAHPADNSETHLLPRMMATMGWPTREMDVISPYFVPGKAFQQRIVDMRKNGVRVRILTNSLAATDVSPVHAGYKKYRSGLVQGGVELYELKPNATTEERRESRREERDGSSSGGIGGSSGGSSGAALHAKTFAVDGTRVFIGSFNVDPRSAWLNTEMGAVIESPAIAQRLAAAFDKRIPDSAYRVRERADGSGLEWVERTEAGERTFTTEPETGWLRRLWVGFLSLLPFENLL